MGRLDTRKRLSGSQIPPPSVSTVKVRKRRNSTTAASELTGMINKSIDRVKLREPKRTRNTVTGNNDLNISVTSRTSFHTGPESTSLKSVNDHSLSQQPNTMARDPRPLRDKNFQYAMQQEIEEYLTNNKFPLETNHPISIKFLKQPTQKGFVAIFKWLYNRLDPGYKFTKSFEFEVYQVLKTIEYPYLETINKSQISAVGGSNWHKFLGMLHWLVSIIKDLEACLNKLDQSLVSENTQEVTVLNKPFKTLDEQDKRQEIYEVMVERLFIDYITESYQSFLKLEDDYGPAMKNMQNGFQKFTHIIKADIQNLQNHNESLYESYQDTLRKGKKIRTARSKFKALNQDLIKYRNYIDTMDQKRSDWPTKLEKMTTELDMKRSQLESIKLEIKDIEKELDDKNDLIESIQNYNKLKEEFSNRIESLSGDSDKLVSTIMSKKMEAENIYKNLTESVRHYNATLDLFAEQRSKAGHIVDLDTVQIILHDRIDNFDKAPISKETLMPYDKSLNLVIKPNLMKINSEINAHKQQLTEDNSNLSEEINNLKIEIDTKNDNIEKLSSDLAGVKTQLIYVRQESESQILAQRIEIEKWETKINETRLMMEQELSDAEKQLASIKEKHMALSNSIEAERKVMYNRVNEIVTTIGHFKLNMEDAITDAEKNTDVELQRIQTSNN